MVGDSLPEYEEPLVAGMTLRDYIAAHVMASIMGNHESWTQAGAESAAAMSYKCARYLLFARMRDAAKDVQEA